MHWSSQSKAIEISRNIRIYAKKRRSMIHISIFGHAIKLYISHNQKFSVIFLAAWIVLSCWHCQMKKMVLQWKTGPNGKFMSDNLQRMIPQWLCMRKLVIQLLFKIRLVLSREQKFTFKKYIYVIARKIQIFVIFEVTLVGKM